MLERGSRLAVAAGVLVSLVLCCAACADSTTAPVILIESSDSHSGGDVGTDARSPDADPRGCVEGERDTGEEDCVCGTTIATERTCTGGAWSDWSSGVTCDEACDCPLGAVLDTRTEPCGTGCGAGTKTQDQVCDGNRQGVWTDTSSCNAQPTCAAGETQSRVAMDACGTTTEVRTCQSDCSWGAYQLTPTGRCAHTSGMLCPGDEVTETCNGAGNDVTLRCESDGSLRQVDITYGCTVQSEPGAGTRVCPGRTFTRSCWPIASGRARVDWRCDGSSAAAGGGFTQIDEDFCTASSGPEAGQRFCPGEVILRDGCPGARNYYICPDAVDGDGAFVSEATLSCNTEALEWEPLHRGVDLRRWTSGGHRFRALRVDLCDASLRVAATRSADRGRTTSSWGSGQGMLAAVNGGYFNFSGYRPDGCVAFGGGVEWPDSADSAARSFIAFGPGAVGIDVAARVAAPPYPLYPYIEEAVCGDATLVAGGAPQTVPTTARARTGVGISANAETLYLLTVDENGSAGMSLTDFAVELAALGVDFGINLDGGGSTTMWAQGLGVVNVPTAGSQRVVSNHLGIWLEGGPSGYNCPR